MLVNVRAALRTEIPICAVSHPVMLAPGFNFFFLLKRLCLFIFHSCRKNMVSLEGPSLEFSTEGIRFNTLLMTVLNLFFVYQNPTLQ